MEHSTPITEVQKGELDKKTASEGPEYVEFLFAHRPDVLNARVDIFIQYETALLGQVQNQVASAMSTHFVATPDKEAKPLLLRVNVKHYSGKERNCITLWIREIKMVMRSGLISLEHRRV